MCTKYKYRFIYGFSLITECLPQTYSSCCCFQHKIQKQQKFFFHLLLTASSDLCKCLEFWCIRLVLALPPPNTII